MANEKMLMALLLFKGVHPEGHTFEDLVRAASRVMIFDEKLKKLLIRIDDMLPLCSLDPAPPPVIDSIDVDMFVKATRETRTIVDSVVLTSLDSLYG